MLVHNNGDALIQPLASIFLQTDSVTSRRTLGYGLVPKKDFCSDETIW
jgi:hypothetical protein